MKHPNTVVKAVLTSEKGLAMQEKQNRYMVRVDRAATKPEIKKAVEDFFNVTVVSVNTQNHAGKKRVLRNRKTVQAPDWKRAIVALKPGDKIDLL
ncbi:MAG: 50S ribosomal protein L23 [Kiritimatiellae bacterium]|nr:50S ribosomal protein L23 [Kiritimatiellia bacterium]